MRDGVAHPAMNLASAMLVAGAGGVVRVDPVSRVPLPSGATAVPAPPGADRDARAALGLTTSQPVPAELVSLLPMGPVLDPEAARQDFTAAAATGG